MESWPRRKPCVKERLCAELLVGEYSLKWNIPTMSLAEQVPAEGHEVVWPCRQNVELWRLNVICSCRSYLS